MHPWHQLCEIWRCYDNWHTYLVETAFKRIILWIEAFLKMAAIFDFHLYGDFFLHSTWWISFGSRITQQKFIEEHWLNIFHYWLSSQINAVICLKKIKMAASAILIFSIKSIFSFLFKWLDSLNHCYSHFNFLHELELKVASISIFCVLWSRFLLRDRPNFGPDISFPSKKYSWDWKNENCFEIITKFYN